MPTMQGFSPSSRHLLIASLLCPVLATIVSGCGSHLPTCEAAPTVNIKPDLIAANGLIYLNAYNGDTLYALRVSNGGIQWTFADSYAQLLAVDAGVAYLQSHDTVYGLRASDGHSIYRPVAFRVWSQDQVDCGPTCQRWQAAVACADEGIA